MNETSCALIIGAGIVLLIGLGIISYFVPLGLYFSAQFSGVKVGIGELITMRLRHIPQGDVVKPMIMARQAGLPGITLDDLQSYYMQGGRVSSVVSAMIAADRADLNLTFIEACAIDRAGRDVLGAVKMSVNPKVIETSQIGAVAQDGIELIVICRVTIKANIKQLVGGAGEETIIARVQEGIVTAIGSSEHFQTVLEAPDIISKTVLQKGLDNDTAFEILSIDIADIDVGRNIGANLQINQAEADKEIAQAKAETRRSAAKALEQEMKAKLQEMKAKVVDAQSQVPIAMGDALKTGKMSIMDYYNLKNVIADTEMRQAISGKTE